jgi:putative FmdB family regulatory protein
VILYDFHCTACDHRFESLVSKGTDQELCPLCGVEASRIVSAPHITVIGKDPARKAEALAKRSHEHTVREAQKNPEKIAKAYGGTPRAQQRWNLRSQKSS